MRKAPALRRARDRATFAQPGHQQKRTAAMTEVPQSSDPQSADPPGSSSLGSGVPLAPVSRASIPARLQAGLPRGVIIVVGIAAGVITLAGLRAVSGIIAPIFLAVVLIITVHPLRTWLVRKGCPGWLATLLLIVGVYAILIGLVIAFIIGIAKLAEIMPQYTDQINARIASVKTTASSMGITEAQVDKILKGIDPSTIFNAIGGIVSSVAGVATNLLFVLVLVLFMGVDGSVFPERRKKAPEYRIPVLKALDSFAFGTRKYFAVATIFGGIVAVLDWIALIIFAIPAAGLWALLAFVTNYIPNIGFIIGLIPVALLALLTGGVSKMISIIVVYCVLNFIIQSVLQPKFVGDAVGLTTTMSFLSLIVWTYVLGPLGAILAIPVSLLVKAILVDSDPDAKWLQLFFGDEPVFTTKDPDRPKRHIFRRRHTEAPRGRGSRRAPGRHLLRHRDARRRHRTARPPSRGRVDPGADGALGDGADGRVLRHPVGTAAGGRHRGAGDRPAPRRPRAVHPGPIDRLVTLPEAAGDRRARCRRAVAAGGLRVRLLPDRVRRARQLRPATGQDRLAVLHRHGVRHRRLRGHRPGLVGGQDRDLRAHAGRPVRVRRHREADLRRGPSRPAAPHRRAPLRPQ